MTALRVASWNILAAPWAAPAFYPAAMDMRVLDRERRAGLVAEKLLALDADIVCLQETTPVDLLRILERIGDRYEHHQVGNGRDLWVGWSTPEVPWEANGTAVLWKHAEFSEDHRGSCPLSGDGNVATWVGLTHRYGTRVRVMSVHLDADDAPARRIQLPHAVAAFSPDAGMLDIVAGDCNEDTRDNDLATMVSERGFVDALGAVGAVEPTHPYARPSDGWAVLARLDHILVRGGRAVAGRVIDSETWAVETPEDRMQEHLRRTGADHLPIVAEIAPG